MTEFEQALIDEGSITKEQLEKAKKEAKILLRDLKKELINNKISS